VSHFVKAVGVYIASKKKQSKIAYWSALICVVAMHSGGAVPNLIDLQASSSSDIWALNADPAVMDGVFVGGFSALVVASSSIHGNEVRPILLFGHSSWEIGYAALKPPTRKSAKD
jgi:hypothetical protein